MSLILVDGNNWFRRRAEVDLVGNPVRTCFQEVQSKNATVIVVWDGFHALKSRREIYPEYKAKRNKPAESIFESQDLLKKLLKFSKAIQVSLDGIEGDDVIAHLVGRYREAVPQIYIESNDADLWQLGCPMARDEPKIHPDWMVLYKTLVGDPSDNIPGMAGFGKKSFEELKDGDRQRLEGIILNGWGLTEAEVRAMTEPFLSVRHVNWICVKENRELLAKFYKIVSFIPLDPAVVDANMTKGLNRPDLAEKIMKEFML